MTRSCLPVRTSCILIAISGLLTNVSLALFGLYEFVGIFLSTVVHHWEMKIYLAIFSTDLLFGFLGTIIHSSQLYIARKCKHITKKLAGPGFAQSL